MSEERRHQVEAAVTAHLRASGEPVREAFLFERVRSDGVDVEATDFIATLLRMEVQGRVHMDPVHDERRDPAPFAPRFWRIVD